MWPRRSVSPLLGNQDDPRRWMSSSIWQIHVLMLQEFRTSCYASWHPGSLLCGGTSRLKSLGEQLYWCASDHPRKASNKPGWLVMLSPWPPSQQTQTHNSPHSWNFTVRLLKTRLGTEALGIVWSTLLSSSRPGFIMGYSLLNVYGCLKSFRC